MPSDEIHIDRDELAGYVEGTLTDSADQAVESHLRECSACAAFVDGYVRFLGTMEETGEPESEELLAAIARLDRRMASSLRAGIRIVPTGALARLCQRHAIEALLHWNSPHVDELIQSLPGQSRPRLVAAASEPVLAAPILVEDVPVFKTDGTEARTTARVEDLPRRQDTFALLVEVDLDYVGWNAAIAYVLAGKRGSKPGALALFNGLVDEEGMIELHGPWIGPLAEPFDPSRLKLCLVEPDHARSGPYHAFG